MEQLIPVAVSEIIDLAARRRPTAAEALAEEAFDAILSQIATARDPTAAAFAVMYGAARFLVGRDIAVEDVYSVAQTILNHMVEIERDPGRS